MLTSLSSTFSSISAKGEAAFSAVGRNVIAVISKIKSIAYKILQFFLPCFFKATPSLSERTVEAVTTSPRATSLPPSVDLTSLGPVAKTAFVASPLLILNTMIIHPKENTPLLLRLEQMSNSKTSEQLSSLQQEMIQKLIKFRKDRTECLKKAHPPVQKVSFTDLVNWTKTISSFEKRQMLETMGPVETVHYWEGNQYRKSDDVTIGISIAHQALTDLFDKLKNHQDIEPLLLDTIQNRALGQSPKLPESFVSQPLQEIVESLKKRASEQTVAGVVLFEFYPELETVAHTLFIRPNKEQFEFFLLDPYGKDGQGPVSLRQYTERNFFSHFFEGNFMPSVV